MKVDKKVVNNIIKLTEKECLTIKEISNKLGISESTIKRVRKKYGIGKRDLNFRKDKVYICSYCGKEVLIRRNEIARFLCPECRMKHRKII